MSKRLRSTEGMRLEGALRHRAGDAHLHRADQRARLGHDLDRADRGLEPELDRQVGVFAQSDIDVAQVLGLEACKVCRHLIRAADLDVDHPEAAGGIGHGPVAVTGGR